MSFTMKCCAFIFLTERCNFRCRHCYVSAEPGRGQHMPVTLFRRSLDLLRDVGISDIRLTGGEPTIHPNFSELVELAIRQRFRVGLISNGSGMRQHWWTDAFMSQFSRCWISLYGITPQQHSRISVRLSGQREFRQILEQVGIYSKLHDGIGISASLEPGSSAHVRSFLQLALSFGVKRLRESLIYPGSPRWRRCD